MSNRWCFTCNNPGDYRPRFEPLDMDYMVFQLERGEAGTEHLQGYIRFKRRKALDTVRRYFNEDRMHLEIAKGTELQNKDYCSKDETRIDGPWEFGSFEPDQGKQGKRSDFDAIRDDLAAGLSLAEVAVKYSGDFIRYHSGITHMQELVAPRPPAIRDVQVAVWWGSTGVGKTYRVMKTWPDAYQVQPGRDPWGRYREEDLVVFDEFDYMKWTVQQMNQYLDGYRCPLDARYRDRYAAWTRVLILANSSPISWWPDAPALLIQSFRRRIEGRVYRITSREADVEDCKDAECEDLHTGRI